jgi:hypothetical protein
MCACSPARHLPRINAMYTQSAHAKRLSVVGRREMALVRFPYLDCRRHSASSAGASAACVAFLRLALCGAAHSGGGGGACR